MKPDKMELQILHLDSLMHYCASILYVTFKLFLKEMLYLTSQALIIVCTR